MSKKSYNRTNPPPNNEAALAKIDSLEIDLVKIEKRLQEACTAEFNSEDEYTEWQKKASTAALYKRREINFLQNWVSGISNQTYLGNPNTLAVEIRGRAKKLASEVGYEVVFSEDKPPTSIAAANERREQLVGYHQKLQAAFQEIAAEGQMHHLPKARLASLKTPLSQVVVRVEEELGVIKNISKAFLQIVATGMIGEPCYFKQYYARPMKVLNSPT